MAEDLGRWLRGEPILARPVGRTERFYRCCRRNPRVTALCMVLVLVVVFGVAGILWQWRRAERNAVRADRLRQQAEANLAEARRSFQQARQAVNQFYGRFYEQGILNTPGLENVRREVLAELLRYYKEFVARRNNDPSLRRELAEGCLRMGLLTSLQGNKIDALTLLRRAIQELEALKRDAPDDATLRDRTVVCLNHIGQLEVSRKEFAAARAAYERGIAIVQEQVERSPDDLKERNRLAAVMGNQANMLCGMGDGPAARVAYLRALEIQKELVARAPAELAFKNDLAMTYNNLLFAGGNPEEVLSWCEESVRLRKQLIAVDPDNGFYRRNLARSYQSLGSTQIRLGRDAEGLGSFREGIRLLRQVVKDEPRHTVYATDLGEQINTLGTCLARRGEYSEARSSFEEARAAPRAAPPQSGRSATPE